MGCSLFCGHFHLGLLLSFKESFETDVNESNQHPTTNTNAVDRRKTGRYLITGTVLFQWLTANGEWDDAVGTSRDIGRGGLYIESDSIPPIGSSIKLTAILLSESKPNISIQLGGMGYVRHVSREGYPTIGFGASAVFHVEIPTST
jgi:hypothetical protein